MKVIWLTHLEGHKFFVLPAWIELVTPDVALFQKYGECVAKAAVQVSGAMRAVRETPEEIAKMLEDLP